VVGKLGFDLRCGILGVWWVSDFNGDDVLRDFLFLGKTFFVKREDGVFWKSGCLFH
jgi:hypothetical protein